MTFVDSIKVCFSKYVDFNGRASKSEFWWFFLFTFVVSLVLNVTVGSLSGLFSLAVLLPSLAVGTRRLHDVDKSGWLQLLALIPLIGIIVLIVFWVQDAKEPNRFGAAAADAPASAAPGAQ